MTTLEEAMNDDHAGTRWVVFSAHTAPNMVPVPDKPGWVTMDPEAKADFWGVAYYADWSVLRGKFESCEQAEAYAGELNRLDVQGPILPEFAARRKLLKKLAPYFGSWTYTSQGGPPEGRWPVDPGRYLIFDGGWHGESWEYLAPDRTGIEEHLREEESNVYRIVDLDTGLDVPFKREIVVEVDMPDD